MKLQSLHLKQMIQMIWYLNKLMDKKYMLFQEKELFLSFTLKN